MTDRSPQAIADFDSSSAMLRALSASLWGRGFPGLGLSQTLRPFVLATSYLPKPVRKLIYAWSGWLEAMPASALKDVRDETVSAWMASHYPQRKYPALMIGSSNGAIVHLCAALGIPWLPQTWLIPVRQSAIDPDDACQSMCVGMQLAPALLESNPNLQLHHMHDANQDRLMIRHMTYFRVKKLRLGPAYEAFIASRLEPGGTIFVVECGCSWPVTKLGERHYFQHGGVGGLSPDEYLHGSSRVKAYLKQQGSNYEIWRSPEANATAPEAEWGFETAMRDDIQRVADEHGYRIVRIAFNDPEDVSPLVADLYRWWYAQIGLAGYRLVVDSFILMDPHWTLRIGAVPFWTKFSVTPSADTLERYLESAPIYDHINIMLFSHGMDSVGVAPIERWRAALARAKVAGAFLGVDEAAYPADFAVFARYHEALKGCYRVIRAPDLLSLAELQRFLATRADRYAVRWLPFPHPT